jgi:hypothetical protein
MTVGLSLNAPSCTITARLRADLSVLHLLSAADFSRKVGALETLHDGEAFGGFWEEIFALATATIFAATAGLEAYANELFVDHGQNFPELRQGNAVDQRELRATLVCRCR